MVSGDGAAIVDAPSAVMDEFVRARAGLSSRREKKENSQQRFTESERAFFPHNRLCVCVALGCVSFTKARWLPWSLAQAHARAHARYTTKLKRLTVGIDRAGLGGGATSDVREVGSV